jgi:hypothetical protein
MRTARTSLALRKPGAFAICVSPEFGEAHFDSTGTVGARTSLLRRERPHGVRRERKTPNGNFGAAFSNLRAWLNMASFELCSAVSDRMCI